MSVGRMYFVSPKEGERYFLRLLLTHVTGATSFENLKTVNNVKYSTFKEAAVVLGLIEDDTHHNKCMEEASLIQTGKQLRNLFAIILCYCTVAYPFKLWENHKKALCEDFLYKKQKDLNNFNLDFDDEMVQNALIDIETTLTSCNYSLTNFDFPAHIIELLKKKQIATLISNHTSYDKQNQIEKTEYNYKKFNPGQLTAYNEIIKSIDSNTPQKLFFVDGPGGSGKTFLYNTILSKVRSTGKIAIAMASTGIAALLLDDGNTAHSTLKIPLSCNETTMCGFKAQSNLAELLRKTDVFIWDEAPTTNKYAYETVDRSLRDIMKSVSPELEKIPFGGKIFIFGGDFRQMLPIVPHGNRSAIVNNCISRSYLWNNVQILKLTKNMRLNQLDEVSANEQFEFAQYLLRVGNGEIPIVKELNEDIIQLPTDMCFNEYNYSKLINFVYNDFINKYQEKDYLINRSILCTKNITVDKINKEILNLMPGQKEIYYSLDTPRDEDSSNMYPIDFLNAYTCSGFPPHELELKENAIVILLRNLNQNQGLCNGTRLIIKNFRTNVIEAEIVSNKNYGARVFLPKITLLPNQDDSTVQFKRKQFPIRLAFALTVNKSQGQTIKKVAFLVDSPLFSHGHLYTAMSRVNNRNNFKIMVESTNHKNKINFFVNNIVYKEILTK